MMCRILRTLLSRRRSSSNRATSLRWVGVLLFLACGPLLAASAGDYQLSAGDEIDILVFDEQDLSMRVRLDEAGVITYPYLGNLVATGKTVRELKETIHQGLLGDILIKPSVNVSVVKYRNFYIGGEVKSSGGYSYQPGLTVRQAITLAGGLTEWGSEKNIEILREGSQRAQTASFDTLVRPGDTITVAEGLF